jgi:chemotaxis regulatin CheY-phosphate phosphatase CheZ
MRLLVGKKQLLADFYALKGLLDQYCGFLDAIGPGSDWPGSAQQLLRNHVQFLEQARISLQSLELAVALIRHILALRPGDTLAIPTRSPEAADGAGEAAFAAGTWPHSTDFRHLVAQINSLSRRAPVAMQERLRFLLHGLLRFLETFPDESPERREEVLSEINLLTSNRESRHLVREVARLARDVYNSVQAVSDGLPIDMLQESTEGASEAVRKLRSVIQRLEAAASQNLDQLERVETIQTQDARSLGEIQTAARRIQQDLARMKAAHPDAASAVDRILERMGNEAGATIMQLSLGFEQQSEKILQQVSNQSFQDLSGATLKKTIALVESVELRLLAVLDRYRSVLSLVQNDMALSPGEPAAPVQPKTEASQDQVDQLLAQYGF